MSGSLFLESVTKGLKLGAEAFVCQLQDGGSHFKGDWVKSLENGAIPLPKSSSGAVSILVWMIMTFNEPESDSNSNQRSAGGPYATIGYLFITGTSASNQQMSHMPQRFFSYEQI